MIVWVREQSSLSEIHVYLEPSTPPDEQKADLACLIAIPPRDRCYDCKTRTWVISNPQHYSTDIPALQEALRHLRQRIAKNARPYQKD